VLGCVVEGPVLGELWRGESSVFDNWLYSIFMCIYRLGSCNGFLDELSHSLRV
jgi:hypothetical protein